MKWISSLFKSETKSRQQTKTPKFAELPSISFNFAGTLMQFKHDHNSHNWKGDIPSAKNSFNIFDPEAYEHSTPETSVKRLYKRGWSFYDNNDEELGSVDIDILLQEFNDDDKNLFSKPTILETVLRECHEHWGDLSGATQLGQLAEGGYTYPVSQSEINLLNFNSITWTHYQVALQKGLEPRFIYLSPITSKHWIEFSFITSGGLRYDFYDPNFGIKDTCLKLINDFMNHVHIQLSAESKAQRALAKDPVGGSE